MRAAQRRQISLVFGWSSMPDYWRSRVPARNREIRTPRVGRSHFGGGGSGSRSAVPTYPHRLPAETEQRIRDALATPGRPGFHKIAAQFGVATGTVQRIAQA